MRKEILLVTAALAAAAFPAAGQTGGKPSVAAFDVASIRINKQPPPAVYSDGTRPPPPPLPTVVRPSPAGLVIQDASLKFCLTWAYGVRSWQVTGPDWIGVERYDISAKTAGPVAIEELKPMLLALLTERFHMLLRREQRDEPVMALVVGKGGHKLQAASADAKTRHEAVFGPAGTRWTYRNASLDLMEGPLSGPDWDPVFNMTGLTGGFDFTYERPHRDPLNGAAWLGDIQASLQNQLGLKLERRKAPMEFIVIDRADKKPIEN